VSDFTVVFEAGATHQGKESCKEICRVIAEARTTQHVAVKFQSVFADDLVAEEHDTLVSFDTATGKKKESVYQALKRRELSWEDWKEVCDFAHSLGLLFYSTPSSIEGVKWLIQMGADGIKIAKGDMDHLVLLHAVAMAVGKRQVRVLLDGREMISEVYNALEVMGMHGVKDIAVIHCPSGYPASVAGVHLSALSTLHAAFPDIPIGYADHSVGTHNCFVAIGLGASIIEKTITDNRKREHAEHYMSIEYADVGKFLRQISEAREAMGNPAIIFSNRVDPDSRRGIYALRNIKQGDDITLRNAWFRRPQGDCPAHKWAKMGKAPRDFVPGESLKDAVAG